jgi:predicted RNase H-like HicB family nuclease
MDISSIKNVIWKEGEHYVAQSLNVDVSSFGATKKEALNSLREALLLYFEDTNLSQITPVQEAEIVSV